MKELFHISLISSYFEISHDPVNIKACIVQHTIVHAYKVHLNTIISLFSQAIRNVYFIKVIYISFNKGPITSIRVSPVTIDDSISSLVYMKSFLDGGSLMFEVKLFGIADAKNG